MYLWIIRIFGDPKTKVNKTPENIVPPLKKDARKS